MKIGRLIVGLILIALGLSSVFFPIDYSLMGFGFVSLSLIVLGALLIVFGFRSIVFSHSVIMPGLNPEGKVMWKGKRWGVFIVGIIIAGLGLARAYYPIDFSLWLFDTYSLVILILGLIFAWTAFKSKWGEQNYIERTLDPARM
jgi:hypothetical protein